jgi:hypothetical protein
LVLADFYQEVKLIPDSAQAARAETGAILPHCPGMRQLA